MGEDTSVLPEDCTGLSSTCSALPAVQLRGMNPNPGTWGILRGSFQTRLAGSSACCQCCLTLIWGTSSNTQC